MLQSWRQKLRIVQEWSGVARACIPLGLDVLTFGHYFAWATFLMWWDRDGLLINRAAVPAAIPLLAAWVAGALLLILLGLFLRRRQPDAEWFMHLAAIYYALSQVWGGYLIGPMSFVTGVVMTGAPLVGFILLTRRVTLVATLVAFFAILAINLAAAYGRLPYAPLLHAPQGRDAALLWTHSQVFLSGPHVISIILLSSLMLGHWRKREEGVLQLSLTDPLTQLHNRRSILDLLEGALARSRRQGRSLAVLLLDLDHFKQINDRFGHPVGDRVLQAAAAVLRAGMRDCDEIGRFGGEEFLLLLPDTDAEGARQLAERCRASLAALTVTADNGEPVPVSGSFGLACNEHALAASAEALVRAADEALYAAKQAGRNRVALAPPLPVDDGAAAAALPAEQWQGRLRLSVMAAVDTLGRIDGRPWWQRWQGWRRMVAGTREWSPVAKVGLVQVLLLGMLWGCLLMLLYLRQRPDAGEMLNETFGRAMVKGMAGEIALAHGFLLASIWLRKRVPDARWFQHLGLQFYSLSLLALGYAIGIGYLPAGVIFSASPLIGFILFRRAIVLAVWAVALLTCLGFAYGAALGWLPYAPLVSLEGPAYHLHAPFWLFVNYFFYTPTLLVALVLVDQVLGRWREREAQIRAISLSDGLTRVHNRRSILERLEAEIERSARQGRPLTVALLDLDHFKSVNDRFGHPTGDRVLQAAAAALRDSLREGDAIGRFGGEEFLLLLPDAAWPQAQALLERCRAAIAATQVTADSGETLAISASFGATRTDGSAPVQASELVRLADDALYRAKAAGRNRVEVLLPPAPAAVVPSVS